jgi:hypothetical protein
MLNRNKLVITLGSLLAVILITNACVTEAPEPDIKATDFEKPVEVEQAKEAKDDTLYVKEVMKACNAKLSEAKMNILAEQIRIVGEAFFDKLSDRKWFYFLICIESKFQNEARSPVGATGLTQVMPKYAQEFADACGLGKLDPKDLADSQVNLMIGACRFRELMEYYKGEAPLALAAYNSGLNSPTVRKAAASDIRTGHPETVGYLAAAFVLNQRMRRVGQNDAGSK